MKTRTFLMVALAAMVVGIIWSGSGRAPANPTGRAVLYYTCAMHPQVRESKPGPCPICGMNLTPVFASESASVLETKHDPGVVTLDSESISAINVQTDLVERRPVQRTLHLAGEITGNSKTAAWFEFTVYERDLPWLKTGETLEVSVAAAPGKTYAAQIKAQGTKPFADADFDMMTGSTKVRAEIANPPVEPGDFGKHALLNNLHAEAHLKAETEATLAIPRSAVISRGNGAMVYVAAENGHYAGRAVSLGRVGDEFVEVLGGLKEGEKVVTTGNVLIDSEAQLTTGE